MHTPGWLARLIAPRPVAATRRPRRLAPTFDACESRRLLSHGPGPRALGEGLPPVHVAATARPTIATRDFEGRVLFGPDRGLALGGPLSLRFVGRGGRVRGTLDDATLGPIAVTGQIAGRSISLSFDLKTQGKVRGAGLLNRLPSAPRTFQFEAAGYLQGPRRNDLGDWKVGTGGGGPTGL